MGSKERAEGSHPSPRLKKLIRPPEWLPPRARAPFSQAGGRTRQGETSDIKAGGGGPEGHTGEGIAQEEGEEPRGCQRAAASAGGPAVARATASSSSGGGGGGLSGG